MNRRSLLKTANLKALGLVGLAAFAARGHAEGAPEVFEITLTPEQWKAKLSPESFAVLREESTERPFTSALLDEHREGNFACAGCDLPLYPSFAKFDSGTGWPSFYEALPKSIGTKEDNTLFTTRTECHCSRCGGHMGHIFDDGPQPTGMRHCINGVSLVFQPKTA
jgi:peptide-methionine (R)-S-oxide reductase